MSDLWTAARELGKPTDGSEVKPFYVYVDEFQNFVTAAIAKNSIRRGDLGFASLLPTKSPAKFIAPEPMGAGV